MRSSGRWQTPTTLLALTGLILALLYAPAAQTSPGDLADLSVSKADSPDPVAVGSTLTYAIEVSNLGPQGATGVTVTDRLPRRIEFVSAVASSGSCAEKGRNVSCEIGSLAADPTKANAVTVTIKLRPRRVGTVESSVSVDSVESDPVEANDRAEASTTVVAPQQASSCRGIQATLPALRDRTAWWVPVALT